MEIEKIDFWDAVKILAKDANIDITKYQDNTEKSQKYTDDKEKIKRIHKLAQNFFVDSLNKSDKAKEYLKNERKLNEETIKHFGI
jgi:DNA primase